MTKEFYNTVYQNDHPSQYDGGEDGLPERTSLLWGQTREWLTLAGLSERPEAKLLEVGCGLAHLASIHPGWHGAEYSKTAVARAKARVGDHLPIFEGDAQKLSFEDASFDAVFTWATLEHVIDPNKAFAEIDRLLKPRGYGLIAPAWNCRPWTVKKLEERPWGELLWAERIQKLLIPLREFLPWRIVGALPGRILDELRLLAKKPLPLRYRSLEPRWDLIEKYGHVSDDDALSIIDIHSGIVFFKSRGYEILSHPSLRSRLMARHEPVIVIKP